MAWFSTTHPRITTPINVFRTCSYTSVHSRDSKGKSFRYNLLLNNPLVSRTRTIREAPERSITLAQLSNPAMFF